jgi:hypothetical protein
MVDHAFIRPAREDDLAALPIIALVGGVCPMTKLTLGSACGLVVDRALDRLVALPRLASGWSIPQTST